MKKRYKENEEEATMSLGAKGVLYRPCGVVRLWNVRTLRPSAGDPRL